MKQDMMGWQWHHLKLRSCKNIFVFYILYFSIKTFFMFLIFQCFLFKNIFVAYVEPLYFIMLHINLQSHSY